MPLATGYLLQLIFSGRYLFYIYKEQFIAFVIFSVLKLIHLFSVNPNLGPLQISLGRMVNDIVKFFFIYTVVVFAFASGKKWLSVFKLSFVINGLVLRLRANVVALLGLGVREVQQCDERRGK